MLDFIRTPTAPAPLTGVGPFLRWHARHQWGVLIGVFCFGVIGSVTQAAVPYLLGRAIDDGLEQGFGRDLVMWSSLIFVVLAVRAAGNAIGHRFDVVAWVRSALTTVRLLTDHLTRTGTTGGIPTGEVVASAASDAHRIAEVYAFLGRFLGGLVAYLAVAVVLLRTSAELGLAVLLGIPVVAAILAAVVRPLQRRQAVQREANGRLTTLGSDTVSGLRILRGIGGETAFTARYRSQSQKVREAGVAVAHTQSLLDALQALLPGLFLAGVVWYGARLAVAGEISPGELVTFYGYAAFLTQPLTAATQGVQIFTRARIAVGKVLRVLGVAPATREVPDPLDLPPGRGDLVDPVSGLVVPPGRCVALVAADPDVSAAVAERLGRLTDPAGAAEAGGAPSVTYGGVPLARARLAEVRRRIVVAEATPTLFTGTLADELATRSEPSEAELMAAIVTADARDVLESVPGGLAGPVAEKGRSLSGGQRQRVALARAVLTEAEVLVLIEPTSAVDAHTEARIASRLPRARAGRTTVIVTASPLMLGEMDDVVFLAPDGDAVRVTARSTHADLLHAAERAARGEEPGSVDPAAAIAYRRVVGRSVDDAPAETPGPTVGSWSTS